MWLVTVSSDVTCSMTVWSHYSNLNPSSKNRIKENKSKRKIKMWEENRKMLSPLFSFLIYMKSVHTPIQTRIFWPPPHYQSLKSRGEQDSKFWKEVAIALVDQKHNTEISRNGYPIIIFQGGPPHEPYFITIDNWGQVIIGLNKKTVATYMVGELEVLIWFMRI